MESHIVSAGERAKECKPGRGTERQETETEGGREREKERECVCVCIRARARARAKERYLRRSSCRPLLMQEVDCEAYAPSALHLLFLSASFCQKQAACIPALCAGLHAYSLTYSRAVSRTYLHTRCSTL